MFEEYKQKPSAPDIEYIEKFDQRLADDLDTPGAIAIMWDMVKDKNLSDTTKAGTLLAMDEVLDIGLSDNRADGARSLGVVAKDDVPDDIMALIDAREVARIGREWPEADVLREQITKKGYSVEDTEHGPKVTKL